MREYIDNHAVMEHLAEELVEELASNEPAELTIDRGIYRTFVTLVFEHRGA